MTRWKVKTRKKFDRLSLAWFTRGMLFVSRLLPYSLGVLLGGLLGYLAYYILPRDRERAISHLTSVFGDKEPAWIRRTAHRSFAHLGKAMLETMLLKPGRLSRIVEFQGYDNLRRAVERGKGVVVVTGHIGNWEFLAAAVAAHYPASVVAAPIEPEPVNDMIVKLRAANGVTTILRDRPGASRDLIRVFRETRVLGILIDQDTDVDGAFVDFMGRPAWTPTAAASMAIKFNAPVMFGSIRRGRDNRHTIIMEGPLDLIRTGDDGKDIIANTAMFTKKIETCILQNPEQWVWMHRRWRRQP
jgi:KDO2-lipid IV(A) lauroyltransferase